MTERIFKSIMLVTTTTILFGFLFVVGILYHHFENEIFHQLQTEATYISEAVETFGESFLNNLETDQRITLIDENGVVLHDNQASASTMGNHITREEIKKAIEEGTGHSSRYSETLGTKTLYYAVLLEDQTILRIADYQNTVFSLLFKMIQPILIILIFALCLAWYIAKQLALKITKPINALNLDDPNISNEYSELEPLLMRMRGLTNSLKEQIAEAGKQQVEFKMITDHMTEGFVVIGKDLRILSYNTSICQHLSINTNIQGEFIDVLTDDKAFKRFIERTMKGSHDEWIQEKNERYYQWISNPVKNEGEVGGAVIVMMDVTEKVKRDQFRSEFTANISHELKTPLTSISGFAEIIQNGIVREEDVKSFAGDIFKESQRLIQLVNDIIRISQLDDHRLIYQKEAINPYYEIETTINRLSHAAKKKNINITFNGTHEELMSVPSIFRDVIYNLVDNAIKYNVEGGRVDIKSCINDGFYELVVEDTGIGIPIQDQQRIFERFYRVDKSRSSQNGGTGLGLSIVKHGVTTLNGTIELESVLQKGTEIKIKLPLK